MIEITGEIRRIADADLYEIAVLVDGLQVAVASNEPTRQAELAHRVGEMAAGLALDFMQTMQENKGQYDGA